MNERTISGTGLRNGRAGGPRRWGRCCRAAGRLLGSLSLAGVLLWCFCAYFSGFESARITDPELGPCMAVPWTIVQWRDEGWATTHYGRRGLLAPTDRLLGTNMPHIFLYGDSFAEAIQVSDDEKPESQLTRLLRDSTGTPVAGSVVVGAGQSGLAAAEYYYRIPRFERAFGSAQMHIILVALLERMLPDANAPVFASFVSRPGLALSECPWGATSAVIPSTSGLQAALWNMRVGFEKWATSSRVGKVLKALRMHYLFARVSKKLWNLRLGELRFRPGPVPPSGAGAPSASGRRSPEETARAFDFITAKLREQTRAPILIVYLPHVPSLDGGRLCEDDPDQSLADELARAARAHGIDYLNAGPAFRALYQREAMLAFGFPNTVIGTGHLNAAGIRAMADCIVQHLHCDHVVLPN